MKQIIRLSVLTLLTFFTFTSTIAQNLSIYDPYSSTPNQPITSIEIFLDSANVTKYNNDPSMSGTFDGDAYYELDLGMNVASQGKWSFGRDILCEDIMLGQGALIEAPCIGTSCYIIADSLAGVPYQQFVYGNEFTAYPSTSTYRFKFGMSYIDLTRVSYADFKYFFGTGSRDANGNWTFDKNHYAELIVKVHVNGGVCPNDPISVINVEELSNIITVYPNPVAVGSAINIDMQGIGGATNYEVFDAVGKVLHSGTSNSDKFSIQTTDISSVSGIYFVRLMNDKAGITTTKRVTIN